MPKRVTKKKRALMRNIARKEEKARIVEHNLALYGYSLDKPPPRGCEVHIKHWYLFLRNQAKRKQRLVNG